MFTYRNDLINTIQSFFVQLNTENNNEKYNINEEKHIPFLKSLSTFQKKLLRKYNIIDEEIYIALVSKPENLLISTMHAKEEEEEEQQQQQQQEIIREIIQGDKMEELKRIILEKGINAISPITKSFNEVGKMRIPIIIECIIEKATKCFKYLLINAIEDPSATMKDKNSHSSFMRENRKSRYEWNCREIAMYYGQIEIITILEEKGIEKGDKSADFEAAILSYRNGIVKAIINQMKERNEQINNELLNAGLIASVKSNNINGAELLLNNGADINATNIISQNLKILHLVIII